MLLNIVQARKREGKKKARERFPLPFPGKGTKIQRSQGEGKGRILRVWGRDFPKKVGIFFPSSFSVLPQVGKGRPRQARGIFLAWLDQNKNFRWLGLTRQKNSSAWLEKDKKLLAWLDQTKKFHWLGLKFQKC